MQSSTAKLPGCHNNRNNSVGVICECLASVWTRATDERRRQSVQQVPDALPWILHVWVQANATATAPPVNNILQPILRILRSWAKLKDSRIKNMMVQSGLVGRLQESLRDSQSDLNNVLAMLGLVKDLVFRASGPDKELLYRQLNQQILEQATEQSASLLAQEEVSAVLWNWAALETLGQVMAENYHAWKILEFLLSLPATNDSTPIHRNASSALGCIVAAWTVRPTSSPPELLTEQAWIPARLLQILVTESDVDWRRRCMRTIRCLSSCEWGRSFLWKHSESPEHFLNVLVQVLQSTDGGSDDTRIQACQTIASLLPGAGKHWASLGPYIESVLTQTIEGEESPDKLVLAASHTLYVSLEHSPWKRGNSCHTSSFFERIRSALEVNADDPLYHTGFSQLLLLLAHDGASDESNLVSPPVLTALTILLSALGPDYEPSRKDAMAILTLFLKKNGHKKRLAENEGLLTALVNFCLISNGSLKDEAKHIILRVVPEL